MIGRYECSECPTNFEISEVYFVPVNQCIKFYQRRVVFQTKHSGEEGEGYDSAVEESRQRLLDNTERLERSGKKLDVGYKVCVETEEVGTKILGEYSYVVYDQ